jgi:DNA primase
MTDLKSNAPQIIGSKNNYFKYLMEQKTQGKSPARMGLTWKDEEIVKLLTAIRKKKTISEIAADHERTEGSITSKLRSLAGDYYYNDKRPIEEIQKFTGLTEDVILDAIKRREWQEKQKELKNKSQAKQTEKAEEIKKNENAEIIAMLKDIQQKLDLLLKIS